MRERIEQLSLRAKLGAACGAVAVLLTGVFVIASIVGSGTDYESACRDSIEAEYGYSDEFQEEEIQACAEGAKSWEEQGVSQEEIKRQFGLP